MAAAISTFAAAVAAFSIFTLQAEAASPSFAQLSPEARAMIAHRAAPELSPCPLGPSPAPYDQAYSHLNSSGTLDVRMVTDAVAGGMRNLQGNMDDMQARTEQVSCRQANTRALLNTLGAYVPDCRLGPPDPYAEKTGLRVSDGFPDVTALIAIANTYRHNSIDVLDDMQARIQRLSCEETQIAGVTTRLVEQRSRGRIPPLAPQPCDRPPASPTYVRHYLHMNATGVMDYFMAINVLGSVQGATENWLDDLQGRLEQVGCEQSRVRGQVDALIRAEIALGEDGDGPGPRGPPAFNSAPPTAATPAASADRGPVEGRFAFPAPAQARGRGLTVERYAGREPPRQVLGVRPTQPTAPWPPARPRDRDCLGLGPDPSYVRELRVWGCSSAEVCGPIDEAAMKVVMQMVQDTETATDDLQIRLNRLNCQERNIDAQLAYVFAVRR